MRYVACLMFFLLAIRAQRQGDDLGFYASLILGTIWIEGA